MEKVQKSNTMKFLDEARGQTGRVGGEGGQNEQLECLSHGCSG